MPVMYSQRTPTGIIIDWSGLLADIPIGWQLCDGTNGTPNLIAKFIRGVATDATDPGNTGGEDTVTLVTAELPVHSHGVTSDTHNHPLGNGNVILNGSGNNNTPFSSTGISLGNAGSGNGHENRPAFFELAYIFNL